MSAPSTAQPVELELSPEAAELITRKGRHGQRVLVINWLHASC